MDLKLNEINVTLSKDQKESILIAFLNRRKISLYFSNDALIGNDTLLVPEKSFEWDKYEQFLSNKENFSESFVPYGNDYILCKETFSEMIDNGFLLVPSINDEGVKSFRLYTPPTVVERLIKARKWNTSFCFILDYSLLTNSSHSCKCSVFKNVAKIENS